MKRSRHTRRLFNIAARSFGVHTVIFGAMVGTAATASAQTPSLFQSDILLGSSMSEEGRSIEQTGDGGYVTVSDLKPNPGPPSIVLRKFSNCGVQQWAFTYSFGSASVNAHSVRPTSDGGYIVAGETNKPGNQILMFKVNSSGLFGPGTWARLFAGIQGSGSVVVRERSNGGFVAVANDYAGQLIVVNASGVRISGSNWRYHWRTDDCDQIRFNDVKEYPNGDFGIVGTYSNYCVGLQKPLALRVSPTGVVRWCYRYATDDNDKYGGEAIDLKTIDLLGPDLWIEDGTVIAGEVNRAASNTKCAYAIRMNYDGYGGGYQYPDAMGARSIREQRFGPLGNNYTFSLEGLALATRSFPASGNAETLLLDAFLKPIPLARWAYNPRAGAQDYMEEATVTRDGGTAAVGATGGPVAFEQWLVKEQYLPRTSLDPDCIRSFGATQIAISGFTPVPLASEAVALDQDIVMTVTPNDQTQTSRCENRCPCVPAGAGTVLKVPFNDHLLNSAWNVISPVNSAKYYAKTGFPLPTNKNAADGAPNCLFDSALDLRSNPAAGQYAEIPSYPAINFGTGDFTITFRIYHSYPNSTTGVRSILDKHEALTGYHVYLNDGNKLGIQLNGANYWLTGPVITPNQCHCVSLQVHRDWAESSIDAWVDGAHTLISLGVGVNQGSVTSGAPLRIGAQSGATALKFFAGWIDELTMYNYVGSASSLVGCSSDGNCNQSAFVPPSTSMCTNGGQVIVTGYLCNQDTMPHVYSYIVKPEPVGPGCTLGGPSVVSTSPAGPITVQPGQCVPITITLARPPLLSSGGTGCYTLLAENELGGVITAAGAITGFFNVSCLRWINDGPFERRVGLPSFHDLVIHNDNDSAMSYAYSVVAESEVEDPLGSAISLNDQPEGVPVTEAVTIPAHSSVTRTVKARFTRAQPVGFYSLMIRADATGDGFPDAVDATTLRNVLPADCPADFDGDGFVSGEDFDLFVQLFEQGDIGADFDGDGFVAGDDFDRYVQSFEAGC